jgi:hypothetical protein
MPMSLVEAAELLQTFHRGDLTGRLASLEAAFCGQSSGAARKLCEDGNIGDRLFEAAVVLKRAAGQINVVVHGLGIRIALPHILRDGEQVQSLSLGAGNTGRSFDLETTYRVAEFKFINWRGGPEAVRQNTLFKDFFRLAEADTSKTRYLYLLERDRPLRFLNGRRALEGILSRDQTLRRKFKELYGEQFSVVREYYFHRRDRVELCDITAQVPAFRFFSVHFEDEGAGE